MFKIKYYKIAKSLDDALDALSNDSAALPIAGGTELLVRYRKDKRDFPLVDINRIPEFSGIRERDGRIYIGSTTKHSDIVQSEIIRDCVPILADACAMIGSLQIRNIGTIGGNVGNASPVADTLPALLCLKATVTLVSKQDSRDIPIEKFAIGPRKTVRKHNELIKYISFPAPASAHRGFYKRLGNRAAVSISKVGVAVWTKFDNNRLIDPKVALGAVAPRVIRSYKTEVLLDGQVLSEELITTAADLIKQDATPITDLRSTDRYREDMTAELLAMGLSEWL